MKSKNEKISNYLKSLECNQLSEGQEALLLVGGSEMFSDDKSTNEEGCINRENCTGSTNEAGCVNLSSTCESSENGYGCLN